MRSEITAEAAKASPPIIVYAYAWFHDLTINSVVGYTTECYLVMQAAYLIWKWNRERSR